LANLIDLCAECNNGKDGQWTDTPLEYWAWHQWHVEDGEGNVSPFDFGGWTLRQRDEFLLQAAYWEARARGHLLEVHKYPLPEWK
jgi:hypothetical protein